MDVAEIRGLGFVGTGATEKVLHRGHLPRPGIPGDVDVVPVLGVFDAESEFERLDGPLLPDDLFERFELGRRLEGEG